MNASQELWWRQAKSDFAVFEMLRRASTDQCHLLHYLQMTTEKLGKAYLWRSGKPSSLTHATFVLFIRALANRSDLDRVAKSLGFGDSDGYRSWAQGGLALAYSVQNVSPALATDGPNSEYPWPNALPTDCPASYIFPVWVQLTNTGQGRQLIEFIRKAVLYFDRIA